MPDWKQKDSARVRQSRERLRQREWTTCLVWTTAARLDQAFGARANAMHASAEVECDETDAGCWVQRTHFRCKDEVVVYCGARACSACSS